MPLIFPVNNYFNIEDFPDDPDLRVYHSSMRLIDDNMQHVEAFKGTQKMLAPGSMEPEPLPAVMEFALAINGVVWCRIAAYTLAVRKSSIFSWDPIDLELVTLWIGIRTAMDDEKWIDSEEPRQLPPSKES